MTIALKAERLHNYRLSAYERKENDFYPTLSDLPISLAPGLSRLGFDLPRIALDPCRGDGALTVQDLSQHSVRARHRRNCWRFSASTPTKSADGCKKGGTT